MASYTSKSDYVATAAMHPRFEPHLQVLHFVNRPLLATYWHNNSFSCSQSYKIRPQKVVWVDLMKDAGDRVTDENCIHT